MKEKKIDDGSRDKDGNVLLVTGYQCECKKSCQSWDFNIGYIANIERIHLKREKLKKDYNEKINKLFDEEIEIMKKYGFHIAEGNIHDLE